MTTIDNSTLWETCNKNVYDYLIKNNFSEYTCLIQWSFSLFHFQEGS